MAKSVFTPEKRSQFLQLVNEGQTRMGAANIIGVSWNTVRSWMKSHPKFAARVLNARRIAVEVAEDRVYAMGIGGNFAALRFWLINNTRDADQSNGEIRWMAEGANIVITGPNGLPIQIGQLSPEENAKRIAELQQQIGGYESVTSVAGVLPSVKKMAKENLCSQEPTSMENQSPVGEACEDES